jgi:RNA polymerase sigma-70 factor (ECF subfamily)
MNGSHDDQSLIELCRAGKTEAFGDLVGRYEARLFPTVFRLTGCAEDAKDLLQDTFLRAYEKLDRFHGESSFYTWIYRIAVNLALSDRRKRRSGHRPAGVSTGGMIDPPDDPCHCDPSLPIEREEREVLIQRALNALAADHRAVVVLKDVEGLRYEEIAAVLHVPIGTVRSRLHRARSELRDRLRDVMDLPSSHDDIPALVAPCPRQDASYPSPLHAAQT